MKYLKIYLLVMILLFTQFSYGNKCVNVIGLNKKNSFAHVVSIIRNPVSSIKKMTFKKRLVEKLDQLQAQEVNKIVSEEINAYLDIADKRAVEGFSEAIERYAIYESEAKYKSPAYSEHMINQLEILEQDFKR